LKVGNRSLVTEVVGLFSCFVVKLKNAVFSAYSLLVTSNWLKPITMQVKTITPRHFLRKCSYNAAMAHPGGRPTERKRSELGERIAQAREQAGLSQYELAEKLGVTQSTVAGWERKVSSIRTDTLIKLSVVLKTSADQLLGLKPPRERGPKGRFKSIFEDLSSLPRRQQEYVLPYLEDMLSAQKAKRAS